jgi:hypothetical protein
MNSIIDRQNESIVYDPSVDGYNAVLTFWKTYSGSDPTISSSKLRINGSKIVSYSYYRYLEAEFVLNVPAVPTIGDVRRWGFEIPNLSNRGRVSFQIVDDVFSAVVYNEAGTAIITQTIPWNQNGETWNGVATKYGIRITPSGVYFLVNGIIYAKAGMQGLTVKTSTTNNISNLPLRLAVSNSNADNMDVTAIILKNIAHLS